MNSLKDFCGTAKRIEDVDIPRIASRINVGEDEIHAFMDVEASGSGFDAQGRPKMLREPHVFYRNLPAGPKRDKAVSLGLAYPKWRPGKYPADSYPDLMRAMEIDEEAALKSCSWGLGQILGENHRMVGYDTVQDMVLAFMEDEENHLEAIVSFLVSAGIDDDLRNHDWFTVARVYNGPGHAKHNYAGRMKARFAWWQKKPDTPWAPEPAEEITPEVEPDLALDARKKGIIERVQRRLRDLGYPEVGNVDGKVGSKTRAAILAFRADNGMPLTTEIDHDLLVKLMTANHRPVAVERATATVETVKNAKSVADGLTVETIGKIILGGGGIGAVLDGTLDLGAAAARFGKLRVFLDTALEFWPYLLVVVGGGAAWVYGRRIVEEQVRAYREGRHV